MERKVPVGFLRNTGVAPIRTQVPGTTAHANMLQHLSPVF